MCVDFLFVSCLRVGLFACLCVCLICACVWWFVCLLLFVCVGLLDCLFVRACLCACVCVIVCVCVRMLRVCFSACLFRVRVCLACVRVFAYARVCV